MKKILLICTLLYSFFSISQNACSYNTNVDYSYVCDNIRNNFYSNKEADSVLDNILYVSGLAKRFALIQCDDIDNCYATMLDGGVRVIIYDGDFMKEVAKNNYAKTSILAHEIGHHVNNHLFESDQSLSGQRKMELEADEWSGRTMFQLGYSLDQAQEAIWKASNGINRDDTYSTHPSLNKRLKAIEKGWNSARNLVEKLSGNTNTISNNDDGTYIPQSMRNTTNNVSSNVKNGLDLFDLGLSLFKDKKYDSAIINFTKIINDPSSNYKAASYVNRGLCYARQNNYNAALQDYTQAINISPQYGLAYNNRAWANKTLNNEFCSDFNLACEYDYEDGCDSYLEYCDKSFSGEEYFYMGYDIHNENPELAIEYYIQAINYDYEYPATAYYNIGHAYDVMNNNSEAIDNYTKAIQIRSNYGEAYNNRAGCKIVLGYDGCEDYSSACRYDYELACGYYEDQGCNKVSSKRKTNSTSGECTYGNCNDGYGTYSWADGDKYMGDWKDGSRTGGGTYSWSNGDKYVGEFKNGKLHGQGTISWASGNKYVGEFQNDVRTGYGTYSWAAGSKYVGEFQNGERTGYGTHSWADGDKYVGEFQNGKLHGQGTYYYNSGDKYVGAYKDGKKHGQGTYTWTSGSKYVGAWKDGQRTGYGTYTYSDGRKKSGNWINGELQK